MIKKYKVVIGCLVVVILSSFAILNKSLNKNPPIALTVGNTINGIFNVDKVIIDNNGFQSKYYVSAYFPIDTFIVQNINLNIDSLHIDTSFVDTLRCNPILFRNYAGVITLNNTAVNYINNTTFYVDTTFNLSGSSRFNWNIGGSNNIGAFTFANNNTFPSFNYVNNTFPTTIDTSQDFQVTLSGISHADSVFITFCRTDSVTKEPFIITRFSAANDSVFTIPSEYFLRYSAGQSLYLSIALSNYNIKSTSNQNFLFKNNFEYKTQVSIINITQPQ